MPVGLELLVSAQIPDGKENVQTFMVLYTLKLPIALSAKAATFILSPTFFKLALESINIAISNEKLFLLPKRRLLYEKKHQENKSLVAFIGTCEELGVMKKQP